MIQERQLQPNALGDIFVLMNMCVKEEALCSKTEARGHSEKAWTEKKKFLLLQNK